MSGTITDAEGKTHPVHIPGMIVSGLGRHLFSAKEAAKKGVTTIIEQDNPRLEMVKVVLPLQQINGDQGLHSFSVDLGVNPGGSALTASCVNTESSTLAENMDAGGNAIPEKEGVAMTTHSSADLWHRRMGHMNPKGLQILKDAKRQRSGMQRDHITVRRLCHGEE